MVPGQFYGFSCLQVSFYGYKLVYFRAERKVRSREHLKRYPRYLYLGPTIPPLGLARRSPALAKW